MRRFLEISGKRINSFTIGWTSDSPSLKRQSVEAVVSLHQPPSRRIRRDFRHKTLDSFLEV